MKLQLGVNHVSNTEYHSDNEYLSSSNYKTLLEDPQLFYQEKILGKKEAQKESAAFSEGSLCHTLILEPHLLDQEYAFFPGLRRQGTEWEQFKELHKGKALLTQGAKERCLHYVKPYLAHETAKSLVQAPGSLSEHTVTSIWNDVPTKVRADLINVEQGYILDVKTSSFPVDIDSVRMTIEQWKYQLSAALYTAVMSQHYGKSFDFYFLFLCKSEPDCQVFKVSKETMQRGLSMCLDAAAIYKSCKASGIWEAKDKQNVRNLDIQEI